MRRAVRRGGVAALLLGGGLVASADEARPRLRALGVAPGVLAPGPHNAITDVDGVRVGHKSRTDGDSVRTGVTAILPGSGNLFQSKVVAAVCVGNGFGKAAGFLQVQELGCIETPIVLTNTLAVGTATAAVVDWTLRQPGNADVRSVNAVVGETNDGYLNDIRGMHVTRDDVRAAIESARDGAVAEGCVGAGVGTRAFGWKGGIGTASRRLPASLGGYTVGALVQSNFGGVLSINGVRVGEALGRYSYRTEIEAARGQGGGGGHGGGGSPSGGRNPSGGGSLDDNAGGSCMIVVATDAPLSSRNLERLARRALLGLGRTGSFMDHGSGDFVIAFSTRNRIPHASAERLRQVEELHDDGLGPLFMACVEAVEESIYNSLLAATTTTGFRGRTVEAIPIERLRQLLVAPPPPARER
jgi:D-aminopeptidase